MKTSRLLFVICFVLATIIFTSAVTSGKTVTENTKLFDFVGEMKEAEKNLSIAAIHQQSIRVHFKTIDSLQAEQIEIPLFDGEVFQAIRRETEGFVQQNADTFSWSGKIYGENGWSGDVILTVYKDALAGLIYAPTGVYSIIPQANGAHILVEIDQSLFPENDNDVDIFGGKGETNLFASEANVLERTSELFGDSAPNERNRQLAPQIDDGSLIDVMIVYTDDVRAFLGGTTQAVAFAQQAIAITNTAYQNSAITTRARLVHTMEVNYAEPSSNSTYLNFVRSNATIAAARNTYKADVVGLLIETFTVGNCGIAGLMAKGEHNAGFESEGFSVSKRQCAVDNLTFPHEIGHNQGANHSPENGLPQSQAVFPYAFGYYNLAANFRTVMTYPEYCLNCPRVPYFSNPNINYNGVPTGIVNQRDNARTINNTALVVSRFRDSLLPTAASVSVGGRVVTSGGRGIRRAVVQLTDQSGDTRTAYTNSFGYFSFYDVRAGETYIISISSKNYSFATQVVSVNEELRELNFTALP